ncbi:MAG: TonB-dependent receptor [Ignavibacteriaceae bacterium]|nr:TonB-dependent receptor [Ignavibacteriaceae bacterium]
MKRIQFAILILLFLTPVFAQNTGSVKGKVTGEDGPFPGVNVLIMQSGNGASTDLQGLFEIKGVPPGIYKIRFSFIGFKSIFKDITLSAGETLELSVQLLETEAVTLSSIEVIGKNARDASDTDISIVEISPERAKVLAGAGEDVLRTLQSLPGVLAPNDFSSQLVVRGSGPDQNLIIIDNVEIFNPYRLYGFISMFNPDAVDDISLTTGGFPSRYGDRLSAVLDVTNREGSNTNPFTGSINASVTNANVVLEGKNPFNIKGGWLINSRRTYYDLILEPIAKNNNLVEENVAFPNFYDLQLKATFGPFSGHKFILTGIVSADGVSVISGKDRRQPDSISVNNITKNDVVALNWQYIPNNKFFMQTTASWYQNGGLTGFDSEILDPSLNRESFKDFAMDTISPYLLNFKFDSNFKFRKYALDSRINYIWGNNHLFEAGVGVDFLRTILEFDFSFDPQLQAIFSANPNFRSALSDIKDIKDYNKYRAYAQNKFAISDRLYFNPGIRFDYYEILRKSYFSPRIAFSYGLDEITTLRASWGIFYQSPGYEKLRDAGVIFDFSEQFTGNLEAEKAVHYILGVERWLTNEWNIKAELYYKDFQDLIVPKVVQGTKYFTELIPGRDPRYASAWTSPVAVPSDSITQIPVNGATGESYGLEILLAKRNLDPNSKISGWVSYSFAYADRFEGSRVNPFRFDQRHTVNIVLDYRFDEVWNLGVRWQYGSGFPNIFPQGIRPRIILTDSDGDLKPETPIVSTRRTFSGPGSNEVVYDVDRGDNRDFNGKKPEYHRLDIRVTATTNFWGVDWNFYLDVINLYNRSNIIGYDYFINEDLTLGTRATSMFPILPTIGFSVKF